MGLGLCLVLGAKPAGAENWFALDAPGTPSVPGVPGVPGAVGEAAIEVDMDLFRLVGGRREVPIRVTWPEARVHASGVSFRSVVAMAELECVFKTPTLRDTSFYAGMRGQGKLLLVRSGSFDTPTEHIGDLLSVKTLELLERAACTRP